MQLGLDPIRNLFVLLHTYESLDEGRWDCNQLTTNMTRYNASEDNAKKLESWISAPECTPCIQRNDTRFYLVKCAVNCYIQWYSSLSCPSWNVPINTQVEKARAVLHRFNFIIILEQLKDPKYVSAVENFFGVPGLTEQKSAWCEKESHKANTMFPLEVKKETLQQLTAYNMMDIELYNNISKCLVDGVYDFPKWDADRFASNDTTRVHYNDFSKWKIEENRKQWEKRMKKQFPISAPSSSYLKPSPACNPHFDLATSQGWINTTKFKRLYFYHSRKA